MALCPTKERKERLWRGPALAALPPLASTRFALREKRRALSLFLSCLFRVSETTCFKRGKGEVGYLGYLGAFASLKAFFCFGETFPCLTAYSFMLLASHLCFHSSFTLHFSCPSFRSFSFFPPCPLPFFCPGSLPSLRRPSPPPPRPPKWENMSIGHGRLQVWVQHVWVLRTSTLLTMTCLKHLGTGHELKFQALENFLAEDVGIRLQGSARARLAVAQTTP